MVFSPLLCSSSAASLLYHSLMPSHAVPASFSFFSTHLSFIVHVVRHFVPILLLPVWRSLLFHAPFHYCPCRYSHPFKPLFIPSHPCFPSPCISQLLDVPILLVSFPVPSQQSFLPRVVPPSLLPLLVPPHRGMRFLVPLGYRSSSIIPLTVTHFTLPTRFLLRPSPSSSLLLFSRLLPSSPPSPLCLPPSCGPLQSRKLGWCSEAEL